MEQLPNNTIQDHSDRILQFFRLDPKDKLKIEIDIKYVCR